MPDLLLCTAVPPGLQAAHARLLTGAGLRLEEAGECTALLLADDGALLACGTRSGKVLRQIAVSPEAEGGGACAEVVSALLRMPQPTACRTHFCLPRRERAACAVHSALRRWRRRRTC